MERRLPRHHLVEESPCAIHVGMKIYGPPAFDLFGCLVVGCADDEPTIVCQRVGTCLDKGGAVEVSDLHARATRQIDGVGLDVAVDETALLPCRVEDIGDADDDGCGYLLVNSAFPNEFGG